MVVPVAARLPRLADELKSRVPAPETARVPVPLMGPLPPIWKVPPER